ncbi:recombinase family protein [Saccharospirillum alexandrii]|uniref:recombinase family protein n=1 Tax=Saccharospirillum alexandrii TaxID=2448477 RepID=UPI003734FEB8
MARYIYARTSTKEQNVNQQAELLSQAYPDAIVVKEQGSATNLNRPVLEQLLESLKPQDDLIIYDLSRLSRDTSDFLKLLEQFNQQDIGLVVHNMGGATQDTRTATGKMVLTVLASVNQMQVELMKEKQLIGIETAKKAGKYKGRKPVDQAKIDKALRYLDNGLTKDEAAKLAGVGVATLYRNLKSKNGVSSNTV